MATYNRISKNQRTEIREGIWSILKLTVDQSANNDVFQLFELPANVHIVNAFMRVLTAGGGTTFEFDALNLVNQSGSINLIGGGALDLTIAGSVVSLDAPDVGVETEPGAATATTNSVYVEAVVNSAAPTGTPVVLVGLEMVREDYERI